MFEKAFEPAKRFLGVIGASVGGLTAIFYVVGFLAMQAHHHFLGLTHISVDYSQYLFSGGQFFSYFPNMVVYFWDSLLELAARNFEWLLYALTALVVARLLLRIKLIRNLVNSLGNTLRKLAIRFVIVLQVLFNLVLLVLFLTLSLKLVQQNDLLFEAAVPGYSWLIDMTAEGSNQRQKYFAVLLGVALLSILAHAPLEHWRHQPNAKTGEQVTAPWRSVLSISALLLIILQLLYLPVNYGILLISKNYPTAEFALRNDHPDGLPTFGTPLILIHREGDDYYFYSRQHKKIWQIRRTDLTWLTRTGEVNLFDQHPIHTSKGGEN